MRHLYTLLLCLALPAVLARLAWRGLGRPAYLARWAERFGAGPAQVRPGGIWLHAVSLGEVNAALPLVEHLLARYPGLPLTLTTTTPTGSARVLEALGRRVAHCYLPFDLPWAVAGFLRRVRPRVAVVMETELWPNLFARCRRRRIPLLLANARLSARSARGYRRVARLTRTTLADVTRIAAQAPADADRLIALGAPPGRVTVSGNVKFETSVPDRLPQAAAALRAELGARPVWIAGSTHEGEERLLLEAHAALRRRHPDLLLVLVPRHPERFASVAGLVTRHGFVLARRSALEAPGAAGVYLGDTMGELQLLYAAADVAFVGGSLVPTGGHNLLEPAALGRAVLCGPWLHNFTAVAELLIEAGAARRVVSVAELVTELDALLADPLRREAMGDAGQRVVAANRGALERLERSVQDLLGPAMAGPH